MFLTKITNLVIAIFGSCVLAVSSVSNANGQATSNQAHSLSEPLINKTEILQKLNKQALRFEQNMGQSDDMVKYLSRGSADQVYLTKQGPVWKLPIAAVETNKRYYATLTMQLLDSNESPKVHGEQLLTMVSNYFIGGKALSKVPNFAKVVYDDVYPNIDMAYYGKDGQLEYDFIVKPGASPDVIGMVFTGADEIKVSDGALELDVQGEAITWLQPISYQMIAGKKVLVDSSYTLNDAGEIGFNVAQYDHSQPLIIDPVFTSTTFGGSHNDGGKGVVVSGGYVYVIGDTRSYDLPLTTTSTSYSGNNDGLVAKLDSDLNFVAVTYFGGSDYDSIYDMAVSEDGKDIYIAGSTRSTDLQKVNKPCPEGPRSDKVQGGHDGFIAKLNSDLELQVTSYIGGSGDREDIDAIALSGSNVYVAGSTNSTDLPKAANSYHGGFVDGFVAKLNGSDLSYANNIATVYVDVGHSVSSVAVLGNDIYIAGKDDNFLAKLDGNSLTLTVERQDMRVGHLTISEGSLYGTGGEADVPGYDAPEYSSIYKLDSNLEIDSQYDANGYYGYYVRYIAVSDSNVYVYAVEPYNNTNHLLKLDSNLSFIDSCDILDVPIYSAITAAGSDVYFASASYGYDYDVFIGKLNGF